MSLYRYKVFRGQYTLQGLLLTFVSIIVFSQIYPILKTFISDITATADPSTVVIVELLPFIIVVSIIFGVVWYIIPRNR